METCWRPRLAPVVAPAVVVNDLDPALPQDVKDAVIQITADMPTVDMACAEGIAGGKVKGFVPVDPLVFAGILDACKLAEKNK